MLGGVVSGLVVFGLVTIGYFIGIAVYTSVVSLCVICVVVALALIRNLRSPDVGEDGERYRSRHLCGSLWGAGFCCDI